MDRLVRTLVRLALMAWPEPERHAVGDELIDATVRGFGKRRSWRYLARSLLDTTAAGLARRRHAARTGGTAPVGTGFTHDVRLALRRLLRSPGFAVAGVGIVALGVGANATVYSALRVAISPPPLPGSEALGLVRSRTVAGPDTTFGRWSYPELRELREASAGLFTGLAAYTVRSARVSDPGDPEFVSYEFVTPGYFATLGLVPAAGRWFAPDEEGLDDIPGVVVLSHALWTQRFGGDPPPWAVPSPSPGAASASWGWHRPASRG